MLSGSGAVPLSGEPVSMAASSAAASSSISLTIWSPAPAVKAAPAKNSVENAAASA